MPLYEYECDACGHRFEVIQKFSDAPIDKCPACGSTVHKLQSAPAFHLKVTGWYATDYGRKESKSTESSSESKDSKSEKSTTASDSSKTDATPAKSETKTKTSASKEAAAA